MRSLLSALPALVLSLLAPRISSQSQPPAPTIPEIHATAVAGNSVNLPQDLHGAPGILILGFSQDSRRQVTEWGRRLAQQYGRSTSAPQSISFYELAQLQSVPRPLRGFVSRRIAAAVSEPARTHVVLLSDHEPEWKSATAFSQPGDAYILIVDGTGAIRHRTHGALSEAAFADLKQRVDVLLQPSSTH